MVECYLELSQAILTDSSHPIKILCKFVILNYRERLVLLWGPVTHYPYHANLIEKFCQDNEIPCQWASKPTMLELIPCSGSVSHPITVAAKVT